ncbi:MAG TPA: protoporphyrinogen oxidase [Candidatus Limnocylindrales bacterium]|nr:protoporphyrinogen oxidase [Candidatus Limnocylindrales bacterium]
MSVLVIGGGITGLAAARALARDGVPVTLVEAGPRLGGKIATERTDGLVLEMGPDSFLATRPAAVALARELGLGEELVGTRDPRAVYIRHRGDLVPMPEGLGLVLPTKAMPFARTRLFSWPEKLRMARDVVSPRMLPADDIAVGTFLRRRLGSAIVDRLAGPLVGGVYGTPIDELSLDAVVPQLRVAERDHRSLLFAGLADGRKMREMIARRPPGAKALGVFVSLAGGMGTLVDALEASLTVGGADLRTSCTVRALRRAGTRVAAHFDDGSQGRFDGAVLAVPAPVSARLLEGEVPGAAAVLGTVPHGTSILVTLAYRREHVGRELVGHGYLVPAAEGGPISACTWSSEKWPGRAPADVVLLRMFVRDEGSATSLPEAELVAAARADAERTLAVAGEPLLVRVSRWDGAMPRYTVGHLGRVAAIEAAVTAWPAVTVAGASYRGVGLPDCVTQGQAAATRMGEWLGGRASREAPRETVAAWT